MTTLFNLFKSVLDWIIPILITFFTPAKYILFILAILVFYDTVIGIKAAKFNKEKLSSNRFNDMFAKVLSYLVFVCIGIALYFGLGWNYAIWLAACVPILVELKSIDEKQKKMNKKGIIKQIEETYKFALNIKKKRDKLLRTDNEQTEENN